MAKKSKASKKKINNRQKQKQKQSINININSNNKKTGAGSKQTTAKPQAPQHIPSGGHTTTIVGGTGRGSEVVPQQQSQSSDIGNLLKMMVAGNKDFSGIGNLYGKVNELVNRQSALESRLTDQYGFENDAFDDANVHYNNEERYRKENINLPAFADYGIPTEAPTFVDYGIPTEAPTFADHGMQTEAPAFADYGIQEEEDYRKQLDDMTDTIL
jgi:hypothetical protein